MPPNAYLAISRKSWSPKPNAKDMRLRENTTPSIVSIATSHTSGESPAPEARLVHLPVIDASSYIDSYQLLCMTQVVVATTIPHRLWGLRSMGCSDALL